MSGIWLHLPKWQSESLDQVIWTPTHQETPPTLPLLYSGITDSHSDMAPVTAQYPTQASSYRMVIHVWPHPPSQYLTLATLLQLYDPNHCTMLYSGLSQSDCNTCMTPLTLQVLLTRPTIYCSLQLAVMLSIISWVLSLCHSRHVVHPLCLWHNPFGDQTSFWL